MELQLPYELTNDENRFLSFETASNLYLISFSQTIFFGNKNQKKHHPWSLGFLALISGKVELKRVANSNSLEGVRCQKNTMKALEVMHISEV